MNNNIFNSKFYYTKYANDIFKLDLKLYSKVNETFEPAFTFVSNLNQLALRVVAKQDHLVNFTKAIDILNYMGFSVSNILRFETTNQTHILNVFEIALSESIKANDATLTEVFTSVYHDKQPNDVFNSLCSLTGKDTKSINILRAYTRYLELINFHYSKEHIQKVLLKHQDIASLLMQMFEYKFMAKKYSAIEEELLNKLRNISSIEEDQIIAKIHELISATVRTNFTLNKSYLSLKLAAQNITNLPKPTPKHEVFIYSNDFEGVHLRKDDVARGGIRWSDRMEDFRTEVLGLTKAQAIKNALIVPDGAKGGFIIKNSKYDCKSIYQLYINALLELSDNIINNKEQKNTKLVCYDTFDPYLVVAADKGTAALSDTANAISKEQNFWLDDGFASGGATGYEHKKLGITARGAWESIKVHLHTLDRDLNANLISTVGIGDLSGDVFGNGVIYHENVQLLAAFNHKHIFIDPKPDLALAFKERQRLYQAALGWDKYDVTKISQGGGVFSRFSKRITLSKEIKELLGYDQDSITPNALIQLILTAKVDLLFNGGIGTYIKASIETNADIKDKVNDFCRVDAKDVKAKIIGEGGNLGLSQLARLEYSNNGGLLFGDFIDNSGGVNCSDREVNLKILLNSLKQQKIITEQQRIEYLHKCELDVCNKVLKDNYSQAENIAFMAHDANANLALNQNYIMWLEGQGDLNCKEEKIYSKEVLNERAKQGIGLTRATLSVLMSYTKKWLQKELLMYPIEQIDIFCGLLDEYFPDAIVKEFSHKLKEHKLSKQIIINQITNIIIDEMGMTFIYKVLHETNADLLTIVKAYMIVRELVDLPDFRKKLQTNTILYSAKLDFIRYEARLCKRLVLRLIHFYDLTKNNLSTLKKELIQDFTAYKQICQTTQLGDYKNLFSKKYAEYVVSMPQDMARFIATTRLMNSSFEVLQLAKQNELSLTEAYTMYFSLAGTLKLNWLKSKVIHMPVNSNYDSFAREALRDDVDACHLAICTSIAKHKQDISSWERINAKLIASWQKKVCHLEFQKLNLTILFVLIKKLIRQPWNKE